MFKAVMLSPAFGSHLLSGVEISITISVILSVATLLFLAINWIWNSYLQKIAEAKGDVKRHEILNGASSPRERNKKTTRAKETTQDMED